MKIVIAPDSFKESMTALEAAQSIEKGMKAVFPDAEYQLLPMADGGEGTVQSLVDATDGTIRERSVTGPLGETVQAFFGILGNGKTAVIEMAAASGLHLVEPAKRNPLLTTSRGTGELIRAALDEGVSHIIVGIGGSATNDGGVGMMQALGGKFLDEKGEEIGPGGGALSAIKSIDLSLLDSRLDSVKLEVACDVTNPLTGPTGASAIFGPQKGATPEVVRMLDGNLAHLASITIGGSEVASIAGTGAAGGLGFALLAFLKAELNRGIDIVLKAVNFSDKVKDASLVITGEGRIDGQTIYGKTPIGVAKSAKVYGIPVIGIAGSLTEDSTVVYEHGIDALFSIVPGIIDLNEAFSQAPRLLERASRNMASVLKMGIGISK
ncbi:glycerate kinase [Rossellomorea marisflavi]|uniref:Glycerate kinase n=1 Tax=Rossellomorea marisflavi TaxID=189381 RepID=A0A0M0G213_9BACI|nr:glycerate kinase [Rossellomorea marisflavi]KON83818.1 glycerate kinase [Rossellomorea marisflavi]